MYPSLQFNSVDEHENSHHVITKIKYKKIWPKCHTTINELKILPQVLSPMIIDYCLPELFINCNFKKHEIRISIIEKGKLYEKSIVDIPDVGEIDNGYLTDKELIFIKLKNSQSNIENFRMIGHRLFYTIAELGCCKIECAYNTLTDSLSEIEYDDIEPVDYTIYKDVPMIYAYKNECRLPHITKFNNDTESWEQLRLKDQSGYSTMVSTDNNLIRIFKEKMEYYDTNGNIIKKESIDIKYNPIKGYYYNNNLYIICSNGKHEYFLIVIDLILLRSNIIEIGYSETTSKQTKLEILRNQIRLRKFTIL
ncbi:MAG: hypothetical protein Harvfovirus14_17 [Harvfovirus sp.]|uniref:Uncharacterized protein n=1 Tax=Harvfovirus sp. TaxID=2487768 RepID=A0A3G5A1D1_9VIRU|nr:MAG: hypothetical protein Harvfovirus14_17 [Harvfovirus sp.]